MSRERLGRPFKERRTCKKVFFGVEITGEKASDVDTWKRVGRVSRDEAGAVDRGQIMQNLGGHVQEFGLYPQSNTESSEP